VDLAYSVTVESDAMGEASKRKAGVISPTREAYGQAKSAPNGRKRREIMNYGKQPKLEGDVIKYVAD
jgi:hypothetical protein